MDNTDGDAASEELMRKLHRELNGLKPRSSRVVPILEKASARPSPKRKPERRQGSEASISGSEEEDAKPIKRRRDGASPDIHNKLSHQPSPSLTNSGGGAKVKKSAPETMANAKKPPLDKGKPKPGGPSEPSAALPSANPPQQVFATALEAASAAASAMVKEKVKQIAASRAAGQLLGGRQRIIKCFHAGVRWGITLSPDALKTRADLATALNDAFAGEILSCGRGETLSIVFLDGEGKVLEFPSLRSSGARDSSSKWKVAVEQAIKVYVRRG